jgi:hypothetical protein
MNKWKISGWGEAQLQIQVAADFLCEGKDRAERGEIAEEIVAIVRAIAKGEGPQIQASPFAREEHAREGWARMVARDVVGGALGASERSPPSSGPPPSPDQTALLREIAKLALWHMPNAIAEARQLVRVMEIERLKQPHPADDPAPQI